MASGQGLKQDVALVFGVLGGGRLAGESGTVIRKQLDELVKNLNSDSQAAKRRIKLTLDVSGTKKEFSKALKEQVLANLSGQKQFKLKISSIDATSAINNVRKQLQKMLSALSITNGVQIDGLKDFVGDVSLKKTKEEIEQAKAAAAAFNAQLEQIKTLKQSVTGTLRTGTNGRQRITDEDELSRLRAQYDAWIQKIEEFRASGMKLSDENLAALKNEGIELQKQIELAQQRQAAEQEVTAERAAQLDTLKLLEQSIASDLRSSMSGKQQIVDQSELDRLRALQAQYQAWLQDVKTFRDSGREYSEEELTQLQEKGRLIQQNIALLKQEQDARKKVSLTEVKRAYNSLQSYIDKNPRVKNDTVRYNQLEPYLKMFQDGIESAASGKTTGIAKAEFASAIGNISTLQAAFKAAGKEGNTLIGIIQSAYTKFGGWMLVTKSMMTLINQLKRMVSSVAEIDAAMTELKKVTEETDGTYRTFMDNATERAKTLGATVADTVNATADFARLGYTLEEASQLADAALTYKNVGDGIESISDASESVISTMKAFNIEADQAMFIVDKFNKTGNEFAISSKGVGDALLRSASSLAAANNTLDESIALVTAANNVVQDPDKVGTTMKTVSMYLRAAKTEAEEAGESTEGMAESVSELRAELLALTGGRVDIQLNEDTFKSTYQIMKELSAVWGSLTDLTQANILEMIGGKRNSNVVSGLLTNFQTAEEVLRATAEASGSALEENEKYLDSIAGKLSVFNATFEELSANVIDSELVKMTIDAGTGILGWLNEVIDKFGVLATLAGGAGAIASISGHGMKYALPCS